MIDKLGKEPAWYNLEFLLKVAKTEVKNWMNEYIVWVRQQI